MPEKEPKFSEAETAKKQEEAQEMDKEAEEMVRRGEAKTPQEAIEKIEEKDLEKSPEEILKGALPLAWEEALKFAQEKGFASAQEIKKRIDLAKKYNLELEHFFYDPARLEREIPAQEQIEKTAKELQYVNEFAEEFSRQSQKSVFCIFNARNGTIYSYGMDTMNTQLNTQFEKLARKENKIVPELRDEFARDLKNNEYWKENKKLALMEIARDWIASGRLEYSTEQGINTKFPSRGGSFEGGWDLTKNQINDQVKNIVRKNHSIIFIDTTEMNMLPWSFFNVKQNLFQEIKNVEQWAPKGDIKKKSPKKAILDLVSDNSEYGSFDILLDPAIKYRDVWFDNYPQVLGAKGKKFGHESLVYSTEYIVQSAQRVEYLSEKVKNALRYYQIDEEDRNWFEMNFEGVMLGKKDAPEKGSQEYLAMFRKWVPYETDEKGEAKLDDKGYPVPRKEAPMTMAAEDELARIEAAMEEL